MHISGLATHVGGKLGHETWKRYFAFLGDSTVYFIDFFLRRAGLLNLCKVLCVNCRTSVRP
jgi:hypothetical protein